jgi:NAD(P)-dependent dehydrogenase (short-subunit alcohol dehydrogenase family)
MPRVLITGANRGLGLELTRQALARGDRVIATCRHPGKALALTELAGAHPGHLHVLPLELASARAIDELAREVPNLTDALDIVINNAGMLVSGERFGSIAHKSMVDSFATNVIGPMLLTQALTPLLAKGTQPKVLNISTRLASLAGTTTFGTPSYSMSKTALNMATRQLAAALAPQGITVFCASPGWVRTDMGGANATVSATDSAAGLLTVLDTAKTDMAGRFVDYLGKEIAW